MAHPKANRIELYDLKTDLGEENNLAAKYPKRVEHLKNKLTEIVLNGRTIEGAVQRNDTGYWDHLTWITKSQYDALQAKGK